MSGKVTSSSPWSLPAMSLTVNFISWRCHNSSISRFSHSLRDCGLLRVLFRLPDDHVIAVGAGNRAFDQQNVFRLAHLDHQQVLGGAANLAHVTGHFQTASHGAGKQTAANGAAATVPALGAVRAVTTAEMVPLDDALKAAAFGNADGVDVIARREETHAHDIARLDLHRKVPELADALQRRGLELFQM